MQLPIDKGNTLWTVGLENNNYRYDSYCYLLDRGINNGPATIFKVAGR